MTARPSFFAELKRRNVIRMAGLYLVASWLIVQVTATILPMFGAPEWLPRSVVVLLAVGFIPALAFSWIYEITPDGLRRESDVEPQASITPATGQRMDRAIVALLVLALLAFAFDRFYPGHRAAPGAQSEKSIAVLPFANTSGDPANEYFSDGMSEELINTLGRLKDLTVIGRSSSFQFKGKGEAATSIGAKLGVAYLLDGSVRKAEDKVRIAVELVRASNGASVWSETYDRGLEDIFAVQSEIAQQVAHKLQATLLAGGGEPAGELKPDAPPSGSVEAYNALLQGNFYFSRRTTEDLRHAIELYQRASSLDPRYALALARLVYTRTEMDASFTPAAGEARKALHARVREDLATAERLDPRSAEVALARGYLLEIFELDVAGATVEYRKSSELAPQNPVTAFRLAACQSYIGEYEASLAGFRHMLALDPLSARGHLYHAIVLSRIGRLAEAEAALAKAIALQPQAAVQHAYLAVVLVMAGRSAEAVATAQAEPDEFWRNWALAFAHWASGDRAASDEMLQWLIANNANDAGSQIAQIYAQRGEDEEVFRWLERAFETNDGGLTQLRVSPFLAKYENNPRFVAIARKVRVWPE